MACPLMSHGHKKGVDILMRLPKGQTSELEPPPTYKNIPRLSVNIAPCVGRSTVWAIPLLLISNYSKTDFRGLFGKREIISYCICGSGFLPDTDCKYTAII